MIEKVIDKFIWIITAIAVVGFVLRLEPMTYFLLLLGSTVLLYGLFLYSRYRRFPEKIRGCLMSYSILISGYLIAITGSLFRTSRNLDTTGVVVLLVGACLFAYGLALVFRFEKVR